MNLDDEQFIYRIGKLSLAPNDMVVIKTDMRLDKDQIMYLQDWANRQLHAAGFYNKVIILTCGFELQIVEKEDA